MQHDQSEMARHLLINGVKATVPAGQPFRVLNPMIMTGTFPAKLDNMKLLIAAGGTLQGPEYNNYECLLSKEAVNLYQQMKW